MPTLQNSKTTGDGSIGLPQDPPVSAWNRDLLAQWVSDYRVVIGRDWKVSYELPRYRSHADLIRGGAELFGRVEGSRLIADNFFQRLVLSGEFCTAAGSSHPITLCTKPRGGSNRSLNELKAHFQRFGRTIASTPEVVSGFVAFSVARAWQELDSKLKKNEGGDDRGDLSGFGSSREAPLRSFAPSSVFRSNSKTLAYNSLVGLDLHDLERTKFSSDLFVVERL